jgi:hypothetical protein
MVDTITPAAATPSRPTSVRAVEFDKGQSDHDEEKKINDEEDEEMVVRDFDPVFMRKTLRKVCAPLLDQDLHS